MHIPQNCSQPLPATDKRARGYKIPSSSCSPSSLTQGLSAVLQDDTTWTSKLRPGPPLPPESPSECGPLAVSLGTDSRREGPPLFWSPVRGPSNKACGGRLPLVSLSSRGPKPLEPPLLYPLPAFTSSATLGTLKLPGCFVCWLFVSLLHQNIKSGQQVSVCPHW